jgi:hypothetical protein
VLTTPNVCLKICKYVYDILPDQISDAYIQWFIFIVPGTKPKATDTFRASPMLLYYNLQKITSTLYYLLLKSLMNEKTQFNVEL